MRNKNQDSSRRINRSTKKTLEPTNSVLEELADISHRIFNRVLVVDDDPGIREVIQEFLSGEGYPVDGAGDGLEALDLLRQREFDVVVTDLHMPNLDGFGLMKRAIELQPLTTIIVLSGQGTFENAIEAVHRGAYDFVAKPIHDFQAFKISIDRGLEHKSLLISRQNYQRNLEAMVEEQTRELARTNLLLKKYADQLESVALSVITTLSTAMEEKDRYTAGHSRRVTYYTVGAAECLGITGDDMWTLKTAAQLHDMGKLLIDQSYVNKPGPLNDEEWKLMKEHPAMADRFLAPLPFLEKVRPIIRHHHERINGSGYPDGLSGKEVNLFTQILAVSDSFDAMTSRRSYRNPMPFDVALAELQSLVGLHFEKTPVAGLAEFLEKDKNNTLQTSKDDLAPPPV